jgi:hypothetical protein
MKEGYILTHLRIYSAATIAVAYALIDRLIVETTVAPLGIVKAERDSQNSKGLATCSITCKIYKVQPTFHIQSTSVNKAVQ